jgi:hypothetical protein
VADRDLFHTVGNRWNTVSDGETSHIESAAGPLVRPAHICEGDDRMANTATGRVSGTVLRTDIRTGRSSGSGDPYRIVTALVLVAESGLSEVTMGRETSDPLKGEQVDWLVEFSIYGTQIQGRCLGDFGKFDPAA